MDVSVIIVNYNTTNLTIQSIESVHKFCKNNTFQIILVDNASTDRSIENILVQYPKIITIFNSTNLGFGAANNIGIKIAKGEFVFLLNSDAYLVSDAMNSFCKFMRTLGNEHVAICGAELLLENRKPGTSFGNFPTLFGSISSLGFRYLYSRYYLRHLAIGVANFSEQNKVVDYISGANLFIRSSVIQELGGFDENFFLYFEETELAYRFKKAGYISMILPEIKIVHLEAGSTNGFNYKSYEHYHRSKQLFYKKAYGNFMAAIFRPIDLLNMLLRSATKKEKGNWYRKFKILINS